MKKCTYIDGIGSSQAIDTAGEIVDLKGLDISSLIGAALNWEHESKLPAQIVGKILDVKKIFSEKDCENERHRFYWEKCRLPFLYVVGRLFDDKKESSREVAALFEDDSEHPNEPDMVGFSVEGSKIEKIGSVVTRSIGRKITITHIPANKQCIAEMVPTKETKKDDFMSLFKGEVQLFSFEPSYIELLEKKENLNKDMGLSGTFVGSQLAMSEGIKDKVAAAKLESKQKGWTSKAASLKVPDRAPSPGFTFRKDEKELEKGMYTTDVGERIPAKELQQPNLSPGASKAKGWKQGDPYKQLAGTSIGQGEDVRAGKMGAAKEAAGRALRYEQRLPKPKLPKSENLEKALSAGSMMAAPGQLEGGAALTPESLERKAQNVNSLKKKEKTNWYKRADEAYQSWSDRENFRGYMKKRMPHLADGEIDSIGRVLALKKDRQREGQLDKMYSSYYAKSEMAKTTDVMMANEDMEKYLMQSEKEKK